MAQPTIVDTAKVTDRRNLHFLSIDDVRADLARIEASERAGTLRRTGNWTAGQVINHLATWAEFPYTGTPLRPPWPIRFILKLRKSRYLNGAMPKGIKIPKVKGGTLGTEPTELDPALARYRAALDRLDREVPSKPNAIFGPLTQDEWIRLNLRHAELHLGYLHPR